MRRATKTETAIATDDAQERSLSTGEVLRERGLCPLVLVRTFGAGVHVGLLASYADGEAVLLDARRLWRWRGANSLSEAAVHGVTDDYTRLSEPVSQSVLPTVIELMPISAKAAPTLTRSRWGAG